jgi:predicted phosphodiesterase
MMRIAVIADVHGNLPALEAVLADLSTFEVDDVIVLGDLVKRGPFPIEVLEWMNGRPAIRGNGEINILNWLAAGPDSYRDHPMRLWDVAPFEDRPDLVRIMATLPDEIVLRYPDAPPVHVLHDWFAGAPTWFSPANPEAVTVKMLAMAQYETIIFAHTHVPLDWRGYGHHVLNPGGVGLSFDGQPGASYMILEGGASGWEAHFRRVAYDAGALLDAFKRAGFEERIGIHATLLLQEFRTSRLQYFPFIHWRSDHFPDAPITSDLIETFLALDEADYWACVHPTFRPEALQDVARTP